MLQLTEWPSRYIFVEGSRHFFPLSKHMSMPNSNVFGKLLTGFPVELQPAPNNSAKGFLYESV
jgi:hypothetical protein